MTRLDNRRQFILSAPVFGTALVAACSPPAPPAQAPVPPAPMPAPLTPAPAPAAEGTAALPLVDEQGAQAQSLAYVADATRVDRARQTTYIAGSQCSSCALYQGQPGAPEGPCPIFAGQRVAAAGWCSSWARKA